MATYPQVPRRFSVVQAPTSRNVASVSAADAAAPYTMLSKSLKEVGDGLDNVAVASAEQAGAQAGEKNVRKDDAGNIVVDHSPLPILGNAGAAYNRAARMSALGRLEPEIENKATEMRLAYPNDPDGFQKAWKSYGDELGGRVSDPLLKAPLDRVLAREGGQNYRASLVTADRINTANAAETYRSRLSDIDNKGAALARQGGTDTPEYLELMQSAGQLYGELGADARFKYPAARIQSEIAEMASRHKGEAVIGQAMSMFDKATPQAAANARKHLQDAASDPGLNLTPTERQQIVTRGMAALEGRTSENKALVDANRKVVSETIEGLKTAAPYDVRRVNDLIERSSAMGDVESAYKLVSYQVMHNWRQSIAGLPLPEQAQAVRAMRQGGTLVDRIVGAESGGNPNAQATTSSATGAGQFIEQTWLEMLKKNGAPEIASKITFDGKRYSVGNAADRAEILEMRRDPGLSRQMVAAYAEQNRKQLSDAKVRTDNGALYLAHFLGPGDAIKVLQSRPGQSLQGVVNADSIAANSGIFARNPTASQLISWAERKVGATPGGADDSKLPGAARPWLDAVKLEATNDASKALGARADSLVTALETATGQGRTPSTTEIRDIASVLQESGRLDLVPRVEDALTKHDAAQGVMKLPVATRQAFRAQMQSFAADRADPRERRVIDATEQAVQGIEQGMKSLPYSTGASRGLHAPPGPLDFSNPEALGAEFDRRGGMNGVHQNHDGLPARSIFEGNEGEAFKAALIGGDARVVAGTFGALQRLGDDQLAATLSGDTVKDAVRGAMRSTDPAKYNAVMTSLDAMYQRAPESFKAAFGEDATHALMTWQSNTRYMTPEQVAKEREKQAADPQVRERMKALSTEGKAEASKVSFDEVVKQFDTSWGTTPGPLARALGSQPLPPTDELTQAALMGDFQTQFARRYAATNGDKDEALKQTIQLMKIKWQASPVNGGKLMVNAPETLRDRNGQLTYPAVNGSHQWMNDQLERDIGAALGKPMLSDDDGGTGPVRNWSYTLVPDRQTQAEAQNGQRATYQVVVTDAATGRSTVMPKRFRFDPDPVVAKSRADFSDQRRRVLEAQEVINPGFEGP